MADVLRTGPVTRIGLSAAGACLTFRWVWGQGRQTGRTPVSPASPHPFQINCGGQGGRGEPFSWGPHCQLFLGLCSWLLPPAVTSLVLCGTVFRAAVPCWSPVSYRGLLTGAPVHSSSRHPTWPWKPQVPLGLSNPSLLIHPPPPASTLRGFDRGYHCL